MSGGRFDYSQGRLANELYGWDLYLQYGEDGFKEAKKAAQRNPFKDVELSEMFWDFLCVLQSLDYYLSGDNAHYTYAEDVEYFKNKWLGATEEERVKRIVNNCIGKAKEDISESLGVEL